MLRELSLFYNTSADYLVGVTDVERPVKDDNTVMRLPCKLPAKAVSEIKEFIQLIMIKYHVR